ncbi:MAG: DUF45 domain-containing protein, partial [Lachnospiraceae bacterium]|nr:DUF45 domain-containing protein [Lachnospiraceae bacterium]
MPDGSLLARAPQRMPEREIWAFIREKEDWIRVHREQRMERSADAAADPLSPDQIKELADVAPISFKNDTFSIDDTSLLRISSTIQDWKDQIDNGLNESDI